jgi:hypothetical protein
MSQYHYDHKNPTFILCGEELVFSDSWMANGGFTSDIQLPPIKKTFSHIIANINKF